VSQGLLEADLANWVSDLSSTYPPVVLDTPIDVPRRRAWAVVGDQHFCPLSGELIHPLQEVNSRVTAFSVVTAAFSIVLSRLSEIPSVYVGTPFALRMLASLQNLIGDFVNMVIFKVRHNPMDTFLVTLNNATRSAVEVQRHAMAPFLLLVNSLQRLYPTNDPARNAINQTMVDVVPKDSEEPNPSMSGILDIFLFANTFRGQLWSIECTYNTTILTKQTVRSILVQMPRLVTQAARDAKTVMARELSCMEEVQLVEQGRRLVLTHLRLRVGSLPHAVTIRSGWEPAGEHGLPAARRLKGQCCLELSADLPLAGARAQRPPGFVVKMEQAVREKMMKEQEVRDQRKKQRDEAAKQHEVQDMPTQLAVVEDAAVQLAVEAKDPDLEVLTEIEERRAQARRKLAARSAARSRGAESKLVGEVISLDLEQHLRVPRQHPLRSRAG